MHLTCSCLCVLGSCVARLISQRRCKNSEHNSLMQVPHPTVHDFYVTSQRLQGRSGKMLGLLLPGAPEDLRFRSHFGGSVKLVRKAWIKMIELGHLPPTSRSLVDYLSALMFMFIYAKSDKAMCAMLGGIDIKTMHKRVEMLCLSSTMMW